MLIITTDGESRGLGREHSDLMPACLNLPYRSMGSPALLWQTFRLGWLRHQSYVQSYADCFMVSTTNSPHVPLWDAHFRRSVQEANPARHGRPTIAPGQLRGLYPTFSPGQWLNSKYATTDKVQRCRNAVAWTGSL